ncbi:glycosyltransferase 87 family protein [Ancylobacter amanitiformis]|uniref:DUF2029 domain-containing protein n=1 Tax=Ancylobacter amanitiformis TaxID=217069 RepID=A0ABU0LSH5_9HYPH|nr:glycosyltransferase 87 family protein [Ancylobacter amanitiformis]MDQ0511636.1 hypothetical protein [Ancylobacter amanitiformis]
MSGISRDGILARLTNTPIRREVWVVALIAVVVCVVHGLRLGQDTNWDQRNYHYYGVYALLHGRLALDVAAAQMQSWFNPAGSLLPYFLITQTSPRLATAALSALSALPLVTVFGLAVVSLGREARRRRSLRLAVGLLACVGAFKAPMFLSEIGTTFNDNASAGLVLAALLVLLADRFSRRAYVLAGVLLGVVVGLKLTNAFYVIGWVAAIMAVERRRFLVPLVLAGGAAVLTYLPVGGLWNAYLWKQFGNPLFPIYNNIFQSPLYPPSAMQDERFKPKGLGEALSYFWQWPAGMHPTSELYFVDLRFTLVPIVLLLALAVVAFRREASQARGAGSAEALFDPRAVILLPTFFVVSFTLWLFMFGIQRYVVALEQLAPLVLMLLLSVIMRRHVLLLLCSALMVVAIARVNVSPDWGRVPFGDDWYEVRLPDEIGQENTLFVMLSGGPIAYVIPFFPASDTFVRIEGNLPVEPGSGLGGIVRAKLDAHAGPLRTLAPDDHPAERSADTLASYGLRADPQDCVPILTRMGRLLSCTLVRTGG